MNRYNARHYQLKLQDLAQAIDGLTVIQGKNHEGLSNAIVSIPEASKLPILVQREYSWVTPESLQFWYQSEQYRRKYLDLKRLYSKWEHEFEVWGISGRPGDVVLGDFGIYSTTSRRLQLLEQLIQLADHLSRNDDPASEALFRQLEMEFWSYLQPSDYFVLKASGVYKAENPSLLEIFQKVLKADLARLVRKKFKGIKRDLRQFFRSIVHFQFKNMTDESDADNFLFNRLLNKRLLIVQISHYDNQKHNTSFKKFTQSSQSYT